MKSFSRVLVARMARWMLLSFIFLATFPAFSQSPVCGFGPGQGCSNTDYSNSFMNSSTPATIEYDNWVSTFHSTIVRRSDGQFSIWGEDAANNGTTALLIPFLLNSTNYPALGSATVYKVTGGSDVSSVQFIALASNGLYVWGTQGVVLDNSNTSSSTFQKLTIGGQTDGLPVGVDPADVKMMTASLNNLVIVTCGGSVYVLSDKSTNRGNGSTGNSSTWSQVTTNAPGNPALSGIVAVRCTEDAFIALKDDNTLYTWGLNTYLGDNSSRTARDRATPMAFPAAGKTVKMVGLTGSVTSYYVLMTDGNLYALGENSSRELGDWTTTDRTGWIQPRYTSSSGPVMDNIQWISPNEADKNYGAINVLTIAGNLYAWGENDLSMIGRSGSTANPGIPSPFTTSDVFLGVETGGHTSMVAKCDEANFGYLGHRINGSMGNGSGSDQTEFQYTFATASVPICGSLIPAIDIASGQDFGPTGKLCVGAPYDVAIYPEGGTLTVSNPALVSITGDGTNGYQVEFTGVGTATLTYQAPIVLGCTPDQVTLVIASEACNADLSITKTVDNSTPNVGNDVVFTLSVTNNGPQNNSGISVTDQLPAGLTYVSDNSGGAYNSGTGVWTIGNLANGASVSLQITATVTAAALPSVTNTASVSGDITDPISGNNTDDVVVNPIAPLSVTISSQVNVLCFGDNTGVVTLAGSGGTAPYQYAINAGPLGASGSFTGLATGSYTFTVQDANLLTATVNATITQPSAALAVTPTLTQPECFAFGSIALSVSGGTPPYTYDWADVPGTGNPRDRSGLSAGDYSVTVTDVNGCTVNSGTLTLNAPANCGPINVCQNDPNSIFSVTPDPEIIQYHWTVPVGAMIISGQGTPEIEVDWSGATPGTGQVCVEAENTCGTSAQTCQDVNIIAPPVPNATADPACEGGAINLFAEGGGTYSWTGPNGFLSSSANPLILNASAALHNGTYNVTVTNTAGCSAMGSVIVTVTAPPQLVIAPTNPSCGLSNGLVDLTVSGGTPGYSYVWSNGAITEDLNNLFAGAFTVTVTDAVGCTAEASTALSNTPGPTVTATFMPVSCAGGANGTIDATISGGVPPLTLLWSNGANTEDLSGLAAGNYSLSVTDDNGCVGVVTVSLTQPTAIALDVLKVDVSCFGDATGSIDLIVAGGTGAYNYSWTKDGNPFGGNTQDLSTLQAGVYAVTVTDANNCTASNSITVTQPVAALSVSPAVTNVGCFGESTGQVILTVGGGTAPYTYAWSGPGGFTATTKDILGRIAGSYNVTATDGNGCTFPLTGIMITQPALLAVTSAVPDDVNCFGAADGSINATISGGTSPYTYLWSNGANVEDPAGLSAGTYTLTVTDANGCAAVSANVSVGQPAGVLAVLPTAVNVACFGDATGGVDLTVSGGTGPYSFSWTRNGSPFGGNTEDLSGLTPGAYAVTVTDANNCIAFASVLISQPAAALNATPTVDDVNCFNETNGSISLNVTGGTAPYFYSWTGPGGFTATTMNVSNIAAGVYTVIITDFNNCTFNPGNINVNQPALLAVTSVTPDDVNCFGGADGSIDATISGGTMPYSYVWSNSANVQDPSGLTAGSYSLTVTDANGCNALSGAVNVGQPAEALAATPTVMNAACNGASTGSISLAVSGGTPGYTYLWSNGAVTQNIMNVPAGNYAVTITDLNSCTFILTASVNQPTAITVSEFITPVACNGGSSGAIDLVVAGGTGAYTFAWSNGLPATEDQNGLTASNYTVTITDANLCTYVETFTVGQPAVLTATGVVDDANCFGASDGSINLIVAGGTEPYTYAWSNGANTEDVSGLAAGSYMITVTDFNLCTATQSFTITQPDVLEFTSSVVPNCAAQSNGSISLTISGGTGPFTYNWTGAGTGTNPRTNLSEGTYDVTVTDASGCTATGSFTLVPLSVVVTGFDRDCLGENGQVFATASGGLMPYTYMWSNGAATDNISNLDAGVFGVTVTAGACTATGQATVAAPSCLPPVAVDDLYVTLVNTPVSGTVRANDTDPVYATNTLIIEPITTLDPSIGVIVWDPSENGDFVFTPATNFIGVVMVDYQVCNPIGLCDQGLLTITINSTNAQNDINQTPINVPVDGNVLTNDSDPQGDTQTVTSALADTDGDGQVDENLPVGTSTTVYGINNNNALVVAGTVLLNSNGTYTYTPALNFTGNVPFAYTITDSNTPAATDAATVSIEVAPASVVGNEPPIANDDTNTTEKDVNVSGNVFPNDSDPDGDVITVTSALADTNGDGLVNENLPVGAPTFVFGTNVGGNLVLAGEITLNANGTYTFDPQPTFTGEVPVRYTISDPGGLMDDAWLTITITENFGNATYANDDANSGPQGQVQTGNILTNDFDPEGNTQTVTAAQSSTNTALVVNGSTANVLPSGGTLVLAANGAYTYTPAPNFVGTEIVRYTATDNGSPIATDVATLYLTTLPINNTFAQNDINQTPVNVPVSGNVLTNDNDPQGDTQTVTSALADTDGDGLVDENLPLGTSTTIYGTNNANMLVIAGTVTLNPNGTYTYTPALNYQGTVPFAYTVTDNNPSPATDKATVAIEVIPNSVPGVNEPPVANDDTNTTEQDVNVSGNVLPNDSDPDGDPITVTSALADTDNDGMVDDNLPIGVATPLSGTNTLGVTVPAGTITLNTNGSYTFDPLPTFLGEVPVRYTISDPGGLMDAAVLTITVIPNLGNVTVANDDANSGPRGVVQTGNILLNDFDPEGNTQTVTAALNSANTALVVNGSTANTLPSGGTLVLAANGAYTYTPAPDFVGTEIVRYTATDNGSPIATDVATLYLTTLPINNTFAQNDINQTPVNVPVSGNVLTNDNDPQGDTQTVTSALADTDGDGLVDDNLPLGASTTIYGTNNANMLVIAGTVTLNPNGTYTYTPALDYQGTVPFAYTVTDNNASPATDRATVTIEVIPESIPGNNEPPVANDDTNTTEQDVNVSGNVLPNDSDPDGDPITVTSALADTDNDGMVDDNLPIGVATPISGTNTLGVTVPAGTITLNTNGSYTFDPLPTFLGEVPVRYTISDPGGLMDAAVLTITVIPNLGNVTFANDDANSGPQGQVQTGNILTNDFDPEGNTQTVTAAQSSTNTALVVNGVTANPLPSGGTLVLFANGAYTYTPAVGFVGTEIVRYTATDNGSPTATDVATLYLTTLPFGCITIEAYVYLEGSLIVPQTGLYQAPPMRTALNNLGVLPGQSIYDIVNDVIVYTPPLGATGQAYNIAPWNYQGAEGNGFNSNGSGNPADAGYSSNVVDWVLVALRNGPGASAQIVCQRAGLLYQDGHIEFVNDGTCCVLDQGATYYLTIEHRNHLIVMSHTALPVVNGKITYDFRNKESYIDDPLQLGVFVGQKQIQTGVFAMFAGNGDQSLSSGNFTDINAADFGKWLNNSPRFLTYSILDYNMDGDVSALDFELWLRNTQKFTSVPQR